MILAEVHLRRAQAPLLEPVAFLLAGADPSAWLREIAGWSLSEEAQLAATLHVLPSEQGALLVLPGSESTSFAPLPSRVGRAYGKLAPSRLSRKVLYLPIDGLLEPSPTPEELDALLRHDVTLVHPTLGWIGFEASRAMRLWSLLAFPRLSPGRWRRPPDVPPWNRRIVSVSLPVELTLEAFFDEEKNAIASEGLDALPPAEGEPRNESWPRAGRKLTEMLARGAHELARRMPTGASEPTWVNRLDDWAKSKLGRVSRELEQIRNRELYRLLELLEKNVEQGLRHAIPLGDTGLFRGLATPGGRLSEREVDFRLGALGGGRPADFWDAPRQIQEKLREKYRELANREVKLGRFRRAAYIYAQLLGELDAAASVLEKGKHFREAAEIYRRHLDKPGEAARALEAGGFYPEAVAIYVELRKWEKAGDIYRVMERENEAIDAYEKARDNFLASRDRLGASRVAESKLRDLDEALEILEGGWPDTLQAEPCLRRALEIHASNGLSQRTGLLLDRLSEESTPPHLVVGLASCLADTAASYPDRALRHRASDLTRRKIASRLVKAPTTELSHLLSALYRLAPEDRLLQRDGRLFLASRQVTKPHVAKAVETIRRGRGPTPELVRTILLSRRYEWLDARSGGNLVFVVGEGREELALVRASLEGPLQVLRWPSTPFAGARVRDGSLLMALDASGQGQVLLHVTGLSVPQQSFPVAVEVTARETLAGDPGWLPQGTRAVCEQASSWLVLRHFSERMILSSYSREGHFRADIVDMGGSSPRDALHLAAQNQFVILARVTSGDRGEVLVYSFGKEHLSPDPTESRVRPEPIRRFRAESRVRGLAVAQPFTRSRLLATMERGVLVHWLDVGDSCVVAPDLDEPRASILRNGSLVVSSGRRLRVYRVDPKDASLGSELEIGEEHGPVLAVLPDYTPNQFAALTGDGKLLVYALPSG